MTTKRMMLGQIAPQKKCLPSLFPILEFWSYTSAKTTSGKKKRPANVRPCLVLWFQFSKVRFSSHPPTQRVRVSDGNSWGNLNKTRRERVGSDHNAKGSSLRHLCKPFCFSCWWKCLCIAALQIPAESGESPVFQDSNRQTHQSCQATHQWCGTQKVLEPMELD